MENYAELKEMLVRKLAQLYALRDFMSTSEYDEEIQELEVELWIILDEGGEK